MLFISSIISSIVFAAGYFYRIRTEIGHSSRQRNQPCYSALSVSAGPWKRSSVSPEAPGAISGCFGAREGVRRPGSGMGEGRVRS